MDNKKRHCRIGKVTSWEKIDPELNNGREYARTVVFGNEETRRRLAMEATRVWVEAIKKNSIFAKIVQGE